MPELLNDLRKVLAERPLLRDVIVLNTKGIPYGWPVPHLLITKDENPNIRMHIAILEGHGLVRDLKGDGFAYRMSERLVHYLKKGKPGPGGSGSGG
jgi:hypothetical protein